MEAEKYGYDIRPQEKDKTLKFSFFSDGTENLQTDFSKSGRNVDVIMEHSGDVMMKNDEPDVAENLIVDFETIFYEAFNLASKYKRLG